MHDPTEISCVKIRAGTSAQACAAMGGRQGLTGGHTSGLGWSFYHTFGRPPVVSDRAVWFVL